MGNFGSEACFQVYPKHISVLSLFHLTSLAKGSATLLTLPRTYLSSISMNNVCLTSTASPCKINFELKGSCLNRKNKGWASKISLSALLDKVKLCFNQKESQILQPQNLALPETDILV